MNFIAPYEANKSIYWPPRRTKSCATREKNLFSEWEVWCPSKARVATTRIKLIFFPYLHHILSIMFFCDKNFPHIVLYQFLNFFWIFINHGFFSDKKFSKTLLLSILKSNCSVTGIVNYTYIMQLGRKKFILRVWSLMPEQSKGNNWGAGCNKGLSTQISSNFCVKKWIFLPRTGR